MERSVEDQLIARQAYLGCLLQLAPGYNLVVPNEMVAEYRANRKTLCPMPHTPDSVVRQAMIFARITVVGWAITRIAKNNEPQQEKINWLKEGF
jgi:hypothetical protein